MKPGRAIWLGLLLSQGGEFGFVLFAQAERAQLIAPEAASLFSAVVILSMVATPFLMNLAAWVRNRLPDPDPGLDGPEFSPETNAIVVGYGRFGQTVAQMLMAKRIPVTIIDSKAAQIELSEEFGTKVYYGDGTPARPAPHRRRRNRRGDPVLPGRQRRSTAAGSKAILEAFPQASRDGPGLRPPAS